MYNNLFLTHQSLNLYKVPYKIATKYVFRSKTCIRKDPISFSKDNDTVEEFTQQHIHTSLYVFCIALAKYALLVTAQISIWTILVSYKCSLCDTVHNWLKCFVYVYVTSNSNENAINAELQQTLWLSTVKISLCPTTSGS